MKRLLILTCIFWLTVASAYLGQSDPNRSQPATSASQGEEQLLRIGGLDIPQASYGAIRVGPHSDRDSLKIKAGNGRFVNYYLELSVWASGVVNGRELFVNGDAGREAKALIWFPRIESMPNLSDKKQEQTVTTLYGDRASEENGNELGVSVRQELTYTPGEDWAAIRLIFSNAGTRMIERFRFGVRLDADVPGKDRRPSAEDDLIGFSGRCWYLYDSNQGAEKSDLIALMPLLASEGLQYNCWTAAEEGEKEAEKAGYMATRAESPPKTPDDYRLLLSASVNGLNPGESRTLTVALIECRGAGKLEKIEAAASEFASFRFADELAKNENAAAEATSEPAKAPSTLLLQNYPNPFNPSASIRWQLKEADHVELAIYNLNGELVRKLAEGWQSAGEHDTIWNGTDHANNKVASGVYLYRLKTSQSVQTKKMLFLY